MSNSKLVANAAAIDPAISDGMRVEIAGATHGSHSVGPSSPTGAFSETPGK
jgi:hypothetical protein